MGDDQQQQSLESFLGAAAAFLGANAEPRPADPDGATFRWGVGSDHVAVFDEIDPDTERAGLEEARAWRALRHDAGFGWITGPPEYGGRGLPASYEQGYARLEAGYLTPDQSYFGVGLSMVAPTILAHASEAKRREWLPALHRGDIVGCQLFSEPGAGSDLASLQTRAVRDGDVWRLTGQKVWTSGAQFSDVGEIIARTDPGQPKHRGLTAFIVDMHAPGVEVRPLRQMTGGSTFNEVFFTDVVVADEDRLGGVGDGWSVALTTLMNERAAIGGGMGSATAGRTTLDRLIALCEHMGVAGDPIVRDRLADVYVRFRVSQLTNQRAMQVVRAGGVPGPELSIAKLALTQNLDRAMSLVMDVLGPRAVADTGEWGTYAWGRLQLSLPGLRIAGGSDEVLRNVVSERVLGMPKDPGIDNRTPFKDLLVGTQESSAGPG